MTSRHFIRNSDERGIAMITTLLVLMLMSALLVGFTTVVMSDQRYRFIDRDRGQAFYAASAGIEKLTADLGNLFLENVAPTNAQVLALTDSLKKPAISGITFVSPTAPAALPASQLSSYHCIGRDPVTGVVNNTKTPATVGGSGYTVTFCKSNASSNPTISDDNLVISGTGAYAGMTALQSPYQIDVTAKTSTGGEVHLTRTFQAVAIPVFQFAMFSEADLSFFAGPDFGMGGRVHTNGNLWLAQGPGATLTMTGRITALKDVVRQFLSNGTSIDTSPTWVGAVNLATGAAAPVGNRNLLRTEGSVQGMPGVGSTPWSGWNAVSLGASPANYNGYLRNGPVGTQPGTGAKRLTLPLTASGVTGCVVPGANTPPATVATPCTNVEIVRRPLPGEDVNGILYNERLFTRPSIRILLSDTAADITNIPGVTATAPVNLETNWNVAANIPPGPPAYGPVTVNRPPVALSAGARMTTVTVAGTTLTPAAPNLFRPTFVLSGTPNNIITCTAKANLTFTGCNGFPAAITVTALQTLTQVSPAGGSIGISATTVSTTAGANATITFATNTLRDTFNFAPMPFWNVSDNPATLVTCTGMTAATFTGCSAPVPGNGDTIVSGYMSNAGVSTLGGFIKIERNNADGTGWVDVTTELLNYGIGDTNANLNGASGTCGTTNAIAPNAIVRLQRLRDNSGACNYATDATGAKDPTNWWPNVLFDPREGLFRDANYVPNNTVSGATNLTLGGVMYYVNLDVHNLQKWFKHSGVAPFAGAASTGNLSKIDSTGFSVYFSDRRNNRNAAGQETGEYGFEDFVNPAVANGVPNGTLQTGEDVNENSVLETYGGIPNYWGPGIAPAINQTPPCTASNWTLTCTAAYAPAVTGGYDLSNAGRPDTGLLPLVAQVNRPVIFRRALMLSNGKDIGADAVVANRLTGLTIVSENPVYIQGDWNAEAAAGSNFNGVNAATAVIADAVTLLSNSWNDSMSFLNPYNAGARAVTADGWYRLAIISGKGPSFPKPTVGGGIPNDFGTDGGAHNFLRFLESWSGQDLNYLGSMASLYYNRQAVGTYKGGTVYSPPARHFNFDTNFLNPALLPPLTPMFRDINVIGFSQELRPGR